MDASRIAVHLGIHPGVKGCRVLDDAHPARQEPHEEVADLAHGIGEEHHGHKPQHDGHMDAEGKDTHEHDVAETLDEVARTAHEDHGAEHGDGGLVDEELRELQGRGVAHLESHLAQAHDLRRGRAALPRGQETEDDARRRNAEQVLEAQIRVGELCGHPVAHHVEPEEQAKERRAQGKPCEVGRSHGLEELLGRTGDKEPDDKDGGDGNEKENAHLCLGILRALAGCGGAVGVGRVQVNAGLSHRASVECRLRKYRSLGRLPETRVICERAI